MQNLIAVSVRDVLVCPIAYSLQFGKQTVKRSLMRQRGFEPFIRFVRRPSQRRRPRSVRVATASKPLSTAPSNSP